MIEKKILFPKDIMEEEQHSMLEQEIVKLIDKALRERLIDLAIDDIRIVARELMPDLDRIISDKVKQHFYEIGEFLVNKFGTIGE